MHCAVARVALEIRIEYSAFVHLNLKQNLLVEYVQCIDYYCARAFRSRFLLALGIVFIGNGNGNVIFVAPKPIRHSRDLCIEGHSMATLTISCGSGYPYNGDLMNVTHIKLRTKYAKFSHSRSLSHFNRN